MPIRVPVQVISLGMIHGAGKAFPSEVSSGRHEPLL